MRGCLFFFPGFSLNLLKGSSRAEITPSNVLEWPSRLILNAREKTETVSCQGSSIYFFIVISLMRVNKTCSRLCQVIVLNLREVLRPPTTSNPL